MMNNSRPRRQATVRAIAAGIALSIAGVAFGAQAPVDKRPADTRLADAAERHDAAAVRTLLSQRAVDVNAPQPDGSTALLWAVHHDDVAMTDALLRAGAQVKAKNRYGLEPLFEAARNGNAAIIERLLKAGADANVTLYDGNTVLMLASRVGNVAAVKLLLAHGATVDAREGLNGETALMWAAADNHADVVKLLVEAGADVNATTKHLVWLDEVQTRFIASPNSRYPSGGLTPLIHAVRQNGYDAVQALLAAGANPNQANPDGVTPLTVAAANAHWDVANLLIEKGAEVNDGSIVEVTEMTIYSNMVRPYSTRPNALSGVDVLNVLLKHGAKPDARLVRLMPPEKPLAANFNGPADMTALYRAAIAGNLEIATLLLDAGANINIALKDGSTPLMAAASVGGAALTGGPIPATEQQRIAAVQFCLDHGANIDAVDGKGMTAIHRATNRGFDVVIEYLAKKGARLDLKDNDGRTPLDIANGVAAKGADTPPAVRASTVALLQKLMGIPEAPKTAGGLN